MYQPDPQKVVDRLAKLKLFSPARRAFMARTFGPVDDRLKPVVEHWLTTGQVQDFKIRHVRLKDIISARQADFLTAVHIMNRLFEPGLSDDHFVRRANAMLAPVYDRFV